MSINTVPAGTTESTRFVTAVWPLIDVLDRGAHRLTHNHLDAEDLLQETLLQAYVGFHSFSAGTNLQAWLFQIMRNRWINTIRWRKRRPAETLAGALNGTESGAHGFQRWLSAASAESAVLDALPDARLRTAIAALPQRFRAVVYYVAIEGYSYAEAATVLDIPVGTAMSRMSRARQQLRSLLSNPDDGQSGELAA